jgi:hypothetical protein
VEETSRGVEIMCVHGHDQSVNHFAHQVLLRLAVDCAGALPPWCLLRSDSSAGRPQPQQTHPARTQCSRWHLQAEREA